MKRDFPSNSSLETKFGDYRIFVIFTDVNALKSFMSFCTYVDINTVNVE